MRLGGDTAQARTTWLALVREDSIGYYGLRARREVDLPPLRIAAAPLPAPSPAVATWLGRLDTLLLAGLDTAAQAEVRAVLGRARSGAAPAGHGGPHGAWARRDVLSRLDHRSGSEPAPRGRAPAGAAAAFRGSGRRGGGRLQRGQRAREALARAARRRRSG